MDLPAPARQRVRISAGALSLPSNNTKSKKHKIHTLAASHPFTQQERRIPTVSLRRKNRGLIYSLLRRQLDIVLPTSEALQTALAALETAYVKAEMALARVGELAGTFVAPLEARSTVTMLSLDAHEDDAWCVDPRGVLTLHVVQESYQTLGLVGAKLPFRGYTEHTITLPLHASADSVRNRQKRDAALAAWDTRRREAGKKPWSVLYCGSDVDETTRFATANAHTALVRRVQCEVRFTARGVRVPSVALPARPTDADAADDWDDDMRALFEWVGMVGFGAQRLQANDRADAYVGVYTPPDGSTVGDVTCLRWRGFLGPDFVQRVIDAVVDSISSAASPPFVAITSHAFPQAPVSYLPPANAKDGKPLAKTPARVPSADGEDTWSLVVARGGDAGENGDAARWCLAESIGALDTRWG
ncbi:ribonuclease P 40kDa subunit-domain-containing protein [Mycena vitilis]|nr:ribonuclease P 40kDa subunit-domain-containing protein [Mycena vitilis]